SDVCSSDLTGSGNGTIQLNHQDDADTTVDANNIPLNGSVTPFVPLTIPGPTYTVSKAVATSLTVAAATGTYGGTVNLSATLTKTSDNSGVNGETVSFTLNGSRVGRAATNSSGVATLNNASLSGINAGTYNPGPSSGVAASFAGDTNFLSSSSSNSLTVNAKTLTASIIGNPTRPYDGTTAATLAPANYSLAGLVGTESISVAQTAGAYNSKDVVTAATVSATLAAANFTAGTGTLLTNYVLPTTASGPGHITAVTLTASIIGNPTRPYNGTTSATLASANYSLSGLVSSEAITVTQTSGAYNSK